MKRILLVNTYYSPHYGGVETTLYHIAGTLKKMGLDPVVLTCDRGLEPASRLAPYEVIDGIPVFRFPLPRRKWLLNLISIVNEYWGARRVARRIHRESPISAVFARNDISGLGVLAALGQAIPFLYIPPGTHWICYAPSMVNRSGSGIRRVMRRLNSQIQIPVLSFLQRRLVAKASMVWVFSDVMRSQLQAARGKEKLRVVPPGVDLERFRPPDAASRLNLRLQRGAEKDDLIGLCMARLVPQKNLADAVGAIACLPAESRWVLWIVGDGPEQGLLESMVKRLGVSAKVKFFPPTSKPEEWYAAADLFLMTSRYESFGQTLLEAQASGLPVAGFLRNDAAGVYNATAEVIRQGETGWLVPFGEKPLGNLLRDLERGTWPKDRRESANARAWVESTFTWERFCRQLLYAFEGGKD